MPYHSQVIVQCEKAKAKGQLVEYLKARKEYALQLCRNDPFLPSAMHMYNVDAEMEARFGMTYLAIEISCTNHGITENKGMATGGAPSLLRIPTLDDVDKEEVEEYKKHGKKAGKQSST
jgi:hypothetical protein